MKDKMGNMIVVILILMFLLQNTSTYKLRSGTSMYRVQRGDLST